MKPAVCDRYLFRARHIIKNLLAKLKQYCSPATRYDRTMRNHSAMVAIVCVITWFRL